MRDPVIVTRIRQKTPEGYAFVKIGRPSVLGNPYGAPKDATPAEREALRGPSIAQYTLYLEGELERGGPVRAELERLTERVRAGERLALACWCAPKPCHGDVVKAAILARLEGSSEQPRSEELAVAESNGEESSGA